jgi:GT2 family glycosyltransferase
MSPVLDIILVNWNAGDQLRTCLQSVSAASKDNFVLQRVIIVDNGSTDGSLQSLEQIPIPIHIIRNRENRGFAVACNQGAANSNATYLLFLNCDTKLFADSLTGPIAWMEQPEHQKIGICGICLVDEQGHPANAAARFPTLRVMIGKMTGLSQLFPTFFPSHHMRPEEMISSRFVDQIMGAFFLIRKEVYDQCGGFDEQFFVYFEEVDLSLRAKEAGYDSYFLANFQAFHAGGGLSAQVKAARLFYSLRSRIYYAWKHYSRLESLLLLCCTFTVELGLRLIQAVIRRSPKQFAEIVTGYRMLIQYFLFQRKS